MSNSSYHTSVLLQACIDNLNIQPNGVYVDLTFGGGGHSALILKTLGEKGKLFAFDQDADALKNTLKDPRFTLIPQNFRYLKSYLRLNGITKVDGILGDFGVSSHQFDEASRGFSIRFDAELDMRMNQQNELTAKKIVNEYDSKALIKMFKEYAEIHNAAKLVGEIMAARNEKEISTTNDLKEVIKSCTPKFEEHKYLAKVFQALRIEVNQEMDALKECLTQCVELLESGGRLVMLSYHSLEDRMVKNIIKAGNVEGIEEKDIIYGTGKKIFKNLTSKPILPSEEEIKMNTRARSAKLRVAVKI
ncbi:16S rRNA (cytosine(1402)-N(4))-methyltransferase RsmH [Aurantibacillus circumpalustris]|uniref:16S rRNA (cytosine(1402)-N(4))-methyltransferase RsmH n=1 Tax=Aurantibacillus circumpalustris TaxID=3036359 RepID=UPI00295AD6E5|nr:16S rRNA (cytosine(1402)-N(4))-methyltransferase RsmH [Aurantibacillus circumpalustris]